MIARAEKELLDLLPDYGKGGLDADQISEVEALLTGYFDGLLDADTEAAIDRLIETHPGLAREVDKARSGRDILAKLLPPAEGPLEDPDSPEIQRFLDDLYAKAAKAEAPKPSSSDTSPAAATNVVTLPSARSWFHPIAYALAASIILAVIGGSSWFLTTMQDDLNGARRQQLELQAMIERLQGEEQIKEAQLEALDGVVKKLGAELATAEVERDRFAGDSAVQSAEMAGLRTALEKADQRLDDLRGERSELAGIIDRLSLQLDTTAEARDTAESSLADVRIEQASLKADIARLTDEALESRRCPSERPGRARRSRGPASENLRSAAAGARNPEAADR